MMGQSLVVIQPHTYFLHFLQYLAQVSPEAENQPNVTEMTLTQVQLTTKGSAGLP